MPGVEVDGGSGGVGFVFFRGFVVWCGVFFFAVLVILVSCLRGGFCVVCARGVGVLFAFVCVGIGWRCVALRCKLSDGSLRDSPLRSPAPRLAAPGLCALGSCFAAPGLRGRSGCPVLLSFHARLGSPGRSRRPECLLPRLGRGPLWGRNCRRGVGSFGGGLGFRALTLRAGLATSVPAVRRV